jgi:O-antigen ligase
MLIKILLFLLISSLLKIDVGYAAISVYMLFVIVLVVINLKYLHIKALYGYEIVFFILYGYIIFSSLWSIDYGLSIKIIIGELILLTTYLILRYFTDNQSISNIEIILSKVFKFFIVTSILYYLVGIIYLYILSMDISSMYLNEHSLGIFGLYLEGHMPRFRGLSESPNNYFYVAFLIMNYFIYKKNLKFALLTLMTILLTLSATAYLVLILTLLLNILNKRNIVKLLTISIFVIIIIFLIYNNNEYIYNLLNYRYERILTGSGRFELWIYTIQEIIKSPYFGYGANTSRIILEHYHQYQSAHNSILDMALTTGIFGVVILVFYYYIIFITSLKLNIFYRSKIFINIFIMYIVISMSNNTLHVVYTIIYLYFIYIYYSKMNIYKKGTYCKIT